MIQDMSRDYQEKIVFISGASSGIGQQTAFLFAQKGYHLFLTYHHDPATANLTSGQCLKLGAKTVKLAQLELTDEASIDQVVGEFLKTFDHLDILVNNAGVLISGEIKDQIFADIQKQFETNLIGPIKLTKLLMPYVKQAVINLGSNLGLRAKGRLAAYSASKFGIRGFSQALASEWPNLRVYTVNPGLTNTKMGGPAGLDPFKVAQIIVAAALGGYQVKSGADINVTDYQYGKFIKPLIVLFRKIKRLV
jgi:NAD(P)-dependent dehydrogenase (short-subunit alcohol dehydrogenase family)